MMASFLEKYDNPRTYIGYRRKMMVLFDFLRSEFYMNDTNCRMLLSGLDCNAICRSIEYYIHEYHIMFRSTADNYLTVISLFFKFLDENYSIPNSTFTNSTQFNDLKKSVNEIIQSLKEGECKEPISDAEFEILRLHCDSIIEQCNPDTQYLVFCSAIIVKIIMFVGLKSNQIHKITVGAHDMSTHKLKVNGYTFRIPDTLAQQLDKYHNVRKLIHPYSPNAPLFVTKSGTTLKDKNSEKYCAMEQSLGHKKSEEVAHKAIVNMLRAGLASDVIRNLTGFSDRVCQECVEMLRESNDALNHNRNLDIHLRRMEVFDYL